MPVPTAAVAGVRAEVEEESEGSAGGGSGLPGQTLSRRRHGVGPVGRRRSTVEMTRQFAAAALFSPSQESRAHGAISVLSPHYDLEYAGSLWTSF